MGVDQIWKNGKLKLYNTCATYHRFFLAVVLFDSAFTFKEGVPLQVKFIFFCLFSLKKFRSREWDLVRGPEWGPEVGSKFCLHPIQVNLANQPCDRNTFSIQNIAQRRE